MARQQKTTQTDASVTAFVDGIADEARREDARRLTDLMRDATGTQPAMWGPSIIGYGACTNDAGATWMRLGFSPRARQTSIYILCKPEDWEARLEQLGPHTLGKGCLYVKRLADVDETVLRDLVAAGWARSVAELPDADA